MEKSGRNSPAAGRNRGRAHSDLRLPAVFQQIFDVRGERDRFIPPGRQTEERADAEPAKPGGVSALGAIQPPVEIAFRPGGVHLGINAAIVGFLVNDEAVRAGGDERLVIFGFHRPDFEREGRKIRGESTHAIGQIIAANKFRMFARRRAGGGETLRVQGAALRRTTSSTSSVTRRIGLSREKPQYWQLLMHSLER